jgi:hypothetical protein
MKKLYLAAGALLLGTSALAWAGDKDAMSKDAVGESLAASTMSSAETDNNLIDKYSDAKWSSQSDANLALASAAEPMDKSALGEPVSAKLETGGYAESSDDIARAKLALASAKMDPALDGTQTAMSDKVDPAVTATADTGMGGPVEADATTMASLTPRPATQNYPPCEPGPGDDNCIQLYERGVRAQLASWNAPTGGLADGSATTAMGGPYEPVTDHSEASATGAIGTDAAMNGDGVTDPVAGETTDDTAIAAVGTDVGTEYEGVGGPVVSQSGYPPCEPGPGDDRCIQLYERGVTGAGN